MNWKLKAIIQNVVSWLPADTSYDVYYFIQRRFGNLRNIDPTSHLLSAAQFIERITANGCSHRGKTFLEVGTGRQLSIPISLWLCGAGHITTVDVNPYLEPELVFEVIDYLRRNPDLARTILGKYTEANVYSKRWSELLGVGNDISKILTMTDIQYISPGNAASMAFGDASFDFHISNNVLEHVKPADIVSILEEGKRLLKTSGLFIHKVDFSDHFSHSDKAISSVNFLRYNEVEWRGIAGNRFMFHNRLRINEFMQLLAGTGLKFLAVDAEIDQESLKLLEDGLLVLDPRFTSNSNVDNATRTAWITATA